MRGNILTIISTGLTMTLGALSASASAERTMFVQDRFAIGFWVDPPADENMDHHYADIAAANFTVVIGGFGGKPNIKEMLPKQIELCEKYDLKVLVDRAGLTPSELPESPAVWGYRIHDEPYARDFPGLRDVVAEIREARPGRLSYINLFPSYASEQMLGTKTYDEHVRKFVDEVDVDVLSMDHYPVITPDEDTRSGYCTNLEVMRKYSIQQGIPFWNFFNAMPFANRIDPTEAQMRWQIYTSLAYGAKGVLYFCYWTPIGDVFSKGGAIITAEGRKTRHYEQAKRINHGIKCMGLTLMQLTSTGVHRVEQDDDPSEVLEDAPIGLTDGDYLVGVFDHDDGRRGVLLNNYSFAYTAWPTVKFDVPLDQVREVSRETGEEIPLVDDSPAMDGFQVSLDSGEGRLFLLPS